MQGDLVKNQSISQLPILTQIHPSTKIDSKHLKQDLDHQPSEKHCPQCLLPPIPLALPILLLLAASHDLHHANPVELPLPLNDLQIMCNPVTTTTIPQ
ncbi:hypothetical protein PCANC_10672 [Puccinia coronata f. sp. avenae]|uniref:Uncharacterized protein n=1 Tax=Puccinia coronata f. sp. avenae TaxID=200324 RepID=A0A2N5VG28_9BASI|nr:hypothetical protein PCANC_10672 [Puccinia coronata f. sp. avenae]